MHHYYIAVLNKFNSWSTIYCGTNLPKMSKAYSKIEKWMEGYIGIMRRKPSGGII